ncbi:hypothetical protein N8I77_009621 [Diaporthe amygdali]|uniref:Uncharacterized protein n=1 Tax=Phomopsis amygdali TaxID=1214568 RepID=A0AAD9W3C8_PHOAM|nr:hypothetical protein N8I77_009621 [Diaporthe amygdali]
MRMTGTGTVIWAAEHELEGVKEDCVSGDNTTQRTDGVTKPAAIEPKSTGQPGWELGTLGQGTEAFRTADREGKQPRGLHKSSPPFTCIADKQTAPAPATAAAELET